VKRSATPLPSGSRTKDLPESVPPLEMRVMTADRCEGVVLPEDVPNYAAHSGKFMWKLLAAWIPMGFRTPKVEGVST